MTKHTLDQVLEKIKRQIVYDKSQKYNHINQFECILPAHFLKNHNIEEILEVEKIEVKHIFIANQKELMEDAAHIAGDIFKKIKNMFADELKEVNIYGYIKPKIAGKVSIKLKDVEVYQEIKQKAFTKEQVDEVYEVGDIMPIEICFFDPKYLLLIKNKNGTFNYTASDKEFFSGVSKVMQNRSNTDAKQNARASLKKYKKLYNVAKVAEEDDRSVVYLTDPVKKISSEYFLPNIFDISRKEDLKDKIAFETARYLLEPVFFKAMVDKGIDRKNITDMPDSFHAMLYVVLQRTSDRDYSSLHRIIDANHKVSEISKKLMKSENILADAVKYI